MKKLIIFGVTEVAKLLHFYIERDKAFNVVAFTLDSSYRKLDTFNDLPLVDFEGIEDKYSPEDHEVFVAIGPSSMNKLRATKLEEVRSKGYNIATYISSNAICHSDVGENCLLADGVIVNPFSKVGDNNFFWERAMVAHDSEIGDNCYFSPNSVVSSYCKVGNNSFIGTAAVLKATVKVAEKSLVGASCYISKDTEVSGVYGVRSSEFFGCISEKVNISM